MTEFGVFLESFDAFNPTHLVDYISRDMKGNKVDWKTYKSVEPVGYLKQIRDIVNSNPTHEDWGEVYGLCILSTFSKPFRVNDKIGNNYPLTLWSILVGPSRWAFKSASCRSVESIIIDAQQLLDLDILAPSEFTGEALFERLSTRDTVDLDKDGNPKTDAQGNIKMKTSFTDGTIKYPLNFVFQGELGGWFLQNINTPHMAGIQARLCRIYDNENVDRITVSHKCYKVTDPYMIMTGCTTPKTFYKILDFDDTFFTQGIGNRFLYIFMTKTDNDIDELEPQNDFFDENLHFKEHNEEISKFLARAAKAENRIMSFNNEAKQIFIKYEFDKRVEIVTLCLQNPTKTYYEYMSTLFSFALKISCLHCINRTLFYHKVTPTRELNFEVTGNDMLYAIGLCERLMEHYLRLMENYKATPVQKKIESSQLRKELYVKFIEENGGIATRKELSSKFGISNLEELNTFMEVLIEEGLIRQLSLKELNTIRGKRPAFAQAHNITHRDVFVWTTETRLFEL